MLMHDYDDAIETTEDVSEDTFEDSQENVDEFEDLEEVLEGDEAVEAEEEAEPDEEEAEEPEDSEASNKRLFDEKQQAEVNKIVKARLERHEAKLVNDLVSNLTQTAGIEITYDELPAASKLWGLLKSNPDLSAQIENIIQHSIQTGRVKQPELESNSLSAKEQQVAFKEAVLDLRMSDTTFNKNADKIIAWAEHEGYTVNDSKSLKMAYLAWKGSQGAVAQAVQKATAKKKQETKQAMKQQATVQSTKNGNARSKAPSYTKMSDAAVLANEGLSLFTED